jgi:hypothetical protein
MSTSIKLGLNSILVAGLVVVGVLAFVSLPQFTLVPLQWAGQHLDTSGTRAFWFAYTVLTWAAIGSVIALLMLQLKPRKIALYGAVAFAAFVVMGRGWELVLQGNVYGYSRELVFALTVPLLYWAFVRWSDKRHNKSLKADAVNGAA